MSSDGKWPAEIPATLYFANSNAPGEFEAGLEEKRRKGGFIYAIDYFWVDGWLGGGGWRLVTPFLTSGTLETLAGLVRHCKMTPKELDLLYRKRFRGVLEALKEMHDIGYTHDDVKMDNIFISPTNSFLLGDLGNVREHAHDLHTLKDIHTGAKDYRVGDTQRAIRTYLTFLRVSCGDKRWFDYEFGARREEWSKFYWRCKDSNATAKELLWSDPFWAEGEGAREGLCNEFEAQIDKMREEIRRWKLGETKQPEWYVGEKCENCCYKRMAWDSTNVENELACVCCGFMERFTPWKRRLSQSSY
ncbi:Similar to Serine/threonine-protein kinase WNK2; acc. no. Q3UH66 [Pyronema omphalodes CBS 100304]|uniref:Similar to Serine/threonine-protein kinase WNK2 acc. no. Q3UH66 n=1 Tax=Pyronema omphalodes (strain CBS 100304) TaxID=1076935 RepID=U4LEN6_PYROM|nr:Similar to Serine/threonine-protein kinase WNK2; acc. no. Q3UH66 [Pyronema omphalodes CBS 100304]